MNPMHPSLKHPHRLLALPVAVLLLGTATVVNAQFTSPSETADELLADDVSQILMKQCPAGNVTINGRNYPLVAIACPENKTCGFQVLGNAGGIVKVTAACV